MLVAIASMVQKYPNDIDVLMVAQQWLVAYYEKEDPENKYECADATLEHWRRNSGQRLTV